MYEPLVALASQRLGGRCVAITLSREETFVNTRTRHGFATVSYTHLPDCGAGSWWRCYGAI